MKAPDINADPLYRHVAEDIKAQIATGTWQAGDKLPSEHALCAIYHVSQITVRRALRELAYEGRVYSHHGLGWFVNPKEARDGTDRDVTLLLPDLDWPIAPLVRYLSDELDAHGAVLHLAFTAGSAEAEAATLSAAVAREASVILLTVSGPERQATQRYNRLLRDIEIPVVLMLREVAGVKAPAVILDEGLCVQLTTRHVLSLGHRRVAYAGSDPTLIEGQRRYRGFANTLWEQGLELPLDWVFLGQLTAEAQVARFRRAFQSLDRPTALVCTSDVQAAEGMFLLRGMDLQCPEDVAIVGLGDHDLAPWLTAPLSTFHFDLPGLARAATAMTFDLLAGHTVENVRVSGRFVSRASCGARFGRAR